MDRFPQKDFTHAHRLTVYDSVNPRVYGRTLYSLEWINPRPIEKIEFVQIRVDPEAGPTLALIAVTALSAGN